MGTLMGFGFGIQTSVALCKTRLELNPGTFGLSLISASCSTWEISLLFVVSIIIGEQERDIFNGNLDTLKMQQNF